MKRFDVQISWPDGSVSRPEIKAATADALFRTIEEMVRSVAEGSATELRIKEVPEGGPPTLRSIGR